MREYIELSTEELIECFNTDEIISYYGVPGYNITSFSIKDGYKVICEFDCLTSGKYFTDQYEDLLLKRNIKINKLLNNIRI